MNELRLTGTLVECTRHESASGKVLARLLLECPVPEWMTQGGTQRIPLVAFGKAATECLGGGGIPRGAEVQITGRAAGREHNGNNYANLVAEKVTVTGKTTVASTPAPRDDGDVPF